MSLGPAPFRPHPVGRLVLLDGLRGLAAIGVMLYHVDNVFGCFASMVRGYLFVDLFFLLSGFVLTISAEARMSAPGGGWQFIKARALRLWPTMMIGIAFGAAANVSNYSPAQITLLIVFAGLFLPYPGPREIFPLNAAQWSLMLESFGNVVHVTLLRRLSDQALLASVVVSAVLFTASISFKGSNTFGPDAANWWFATPRVLVNYTLGCWLARKWQARDRIEGAAWPLALVMPVCAVVILPHLPVPTATGDIALVLFVFPPFLWLVATAKPPNANHEPALKAIGRWSFPLYAIHLPIIFTAAKVVQNGTAAAIACATAIGFAIALDRISTSRSGRSPSARALAA